MPSQARAIVVKECSPDGNTINLDSGAHEESSMNNQTLSGAIGAAGLVIQIVLGLALSNSGAPIGSLLILPHMLIGVGGIALVAFLVSWIFFTPSSMIVRLVYVLAFALTFAQVALGFRVLAVPDHMLAMAHQGIAVVILVLLAVGGMPAARGRRKSKATAAAPA
jgi:hypothetical protein